VKEQCVMTSPLGTLLLEVDEIGVTMLEFLAESAPVTSPNEIQSPILKETIQWLTRYFSGQQPVALPPLHLVGTPFQQQVWEMLCTIPYGDTVTYGELAHRISASRAGAPMAAQAVGGAVGKNPVPIMIPCHRVVGVKGKLTGYAAGLDKKVALLKLEGVALTDDKTSINQ
jgi:methylated-DNA-[protein]-cysteine S-methyltransferase